MERKKVKRETNEKLKTKKLKQKRKPWSVEKHEQSVICEISPENVGFTEKKKVVTDTTVVSRM